MREEKKICPEKEVARVEGLWRGRKGLAYERERALKANRGNLDFSQRQWRATKIPEGEQDGQVCVL